MTTRYLHQLDRGTIDFYDTQYEDYVPGPGVLFVAGTNTSGIHGKGAAKTAAMCYGAPKGHCNGHRGRYYGIPTREVYWTRSGKIRLLSLPLGDIRQYVQEFLDYIEETQYTFLVTAVGCGYAGYQPHQIAPLFRQATRCWFPDTWRDYLIND